MAHRNPDFPFQNDFMLGDRYFSDLLEQLDVTILTQLRLLLQMTLTCTTYFRHFLDPDHGLFLNRHDFENICRLFDHMHPNFSATFGQRYIYLFYSRIVSTHAHLVPPIHAIEELLHDMNELDLIASIHLPDDHPDIQLAL